MPEVAQHASQLRAVDLSTSVFVEPAEDRSRLVYLLLNQRLHSLGQRSKVKGQTHPPTPGGQGVLLSSSTPHSQDYQMIELHCLTLLSLLPRFGPFAPLCLYHATPCQHITTESII